MTFAFDLSSRDDGQAHSPGILRRIRESSMSCDSAWRPERIEVFGRWSESGLQP